MKKSLITLATIILASSLSNSFALTAGPDAFGYSATDSTEPDGPGFAFIDISTTGMQLIFPVFPNSFQPDDTGLAISLPHGFPLYGDTLTQMVVSTNGYLSSDLTDNGGDFSNNSLPGSVYPGGGARIYPYHDDLILDNLDNANNIEDVQYPFPEGVVGRVFVESFSNLPDHPFKNDTACTIIQWDSTLHVNSFGLGKFTFQAILFEDGSLYFSYPEVSTGSISAGLATIGIQNEDATIGLQYPATSSSLVSPQAVAITLGEPPLVPLEINDFQVLSAETGSVSLSFTSQINSAYVIEASPSLDFENPTTVLTIEASEVTSNLTSREFTINNIDSNGARGFVRVREVDSQ